MDQQLEELKTKLAQLKGEQTDVPADEEPTAPAVDPALVERRSHFSGAQRRLADILAISGQSIQGGNGFDLIDAGRSEVSVNSDKLVAMQIIRLMLDDDGSDGILYAVTNWKSQSKQTLADRMGDYVRDNECNPQWRLGMQTPERQQAYAKRQALLLKVNYVQPKPEMKLDAKTLVRMSSPQFAEFAIEFHRRVLIWDMKQYVYDNLRTPASQFFAGFLELQRNADAEEESLFKNAMAAHMLATAPDSNESDAEEFLGLLSWMGQRSSLEDMRRLERIAKQKSRGASSQAPKEWAIKETTPQRSPLDDIDLGRVATGYDRQLAEIDAKLEQLKVGQQEPSITSVSA
jgi:hypothetical protein